MNKTLLTIMTGAALSFAVQQAEAAQITGSITFGGTATLDTSSAGTATAVTAWSGVNGVGSPYVSGSSLDLSSVAPFSPVSIYATWSFNSPAINSFWSVGGFTFDLTSSHIVNQAAGTVTVNGTGTISGNGFQPTAGTWSFSTQDPSAGTPATFSFSAASGAVPDGGATAMLLGAGFLGLAGLRRKLS